MADEAQLGPRGGVPDPRAIALMNGHLVIEVLLDLDGAPFLEGRAWIFFGEVVGWVGFTRLEGSECTFVADGLRPATDPTLRLSASAQGVWWRRPAAIEAQQSIETFLAEGDPNS